MNSKLTLILKGSGFRILQTLVGVVVGLLMMPFLIAHLGQEQYGLWILIASVVGTYYLLDLGFNQAVTRYVAKYIHQNNPEAANKIINTALVIYSCLGILVFVISVIAAYFGAEKFMKGTENLTLVQTLLMISGISLMLEFPAKAFPGILSAYMRYDFIALVRLLKSLVDALLIYLFISHGFGLVAMALITLVTGFMSTLIYVKFTTSLFKEIQFSRAHINTKTLKDVFHFSKWVFVVDMTAMLRDKMDIWFIAYYIGNQALTVYYVAVRLVDYALQFLNQATGITGPIFTEYYAKGETEKLKNSVSFFIKLNIALGSTILVGFYLVGTSFIELWMRGSISAQEASICLMLLAMGRMAAYFAAPLASLLLTLNRHPISAWISLFETGLTAALCWVLIPLWGLYGAAAAISIPHIIGRLFILPMCTLKYVDLALVSLMVRFLLFIIASVSVAGFSAYFFEGLKHLTLLEFILVLPLIAFFQLGMAILLCTKAEIQLVKNFIVVKVLPKIIAKLKPKNAPGV